MSKRTTTAPTAALSPWGALVAGSGTRSSKPKALTATTETSPTERQILDDDLSTGQRQMLVEICNKADRCDPRNATTVRMQNAAEDRAERKAEVEKFIEPHQKEIWRLEHEPRSPTEWVLEQFEKARGYRPQRSVVADALARFGIPASWRRSRKT